MSTAGAREGLDRKRARAAYELVQDHIERWEESERNHIKGLPVQLRTQGLAIVVATLLADTKRVSRDVNEGVAGWLGTVLPELVVERRADSNAPRAADLLRASVKLGRTEYLAVQREALAFLEDVKLFTDALGGEAR
jgi:hypothetical protein